MAKIIWTTDLSVGIQEFDSDHQNLVGFLNKLHDAIEEGESSKLIPNLLDALSKYAVYHFQKEEDAFDKYEFPRTTKHKQEHEDFVTKVSEMIGKFNAGQTAIIKPMYDFVLSWIKNHIQVSDKDYTEYLNSQGVC